MGSLQLRIRFGLLMGCAALCCTPSFSQVVNLVDGPVDVVIKFDLPTIGKEPAQSASDTTVSPRALTAANISNASTGLSFYTADYTSLGGKQLPFNIVGTDPSFGAATTTIPTVLVPMKFIFPNTGNPTLDGTNVIPAVQNSPIFLTADYKAGSVDLGVSQYGDALQRGEFWNLPGFSHDYHVLLGTPSVAATITVIVPSGKGNAYALSSGGFMGVLDTTYFQQLLTGFIPSYSANQLPIFVTDDVYLGTGGQLQNCCILGFHASQSGPIATAKT